MKKYIKTFENFEGFKEITFSLVHDDNKEIMFDILSSGKVISIYCYNDGIPSYYNNRDVKVNMRTKPGKNPLFLHINVNRTNIEKILLEGSAFPHIDNEDDYVLLMDMLKYYKIDSVGQDWGNAI
tara:strand:- start:5271 stop:5645 length:375 start_codon:yes stop_codon:yes gene_type:complete